MYDVTSCLSVSARSFWFTFWVDKLGGKTHAHKTWQRREETAASSQTDQMPRLKTLIIAGTPGAKTTGPPKGQVRGR